MNLVSRIFLNTKYLSQLCFARTTYCNVQRMLKVFLNERKPRHSFCSSPLTSFFATEEGKKKKSCGLMVSLQSEISESDEHSISQYL